MTLAVDAQGKKIITIEGLAQGKRLTRLQKAFVDHDALQCGFCTPGIIMSLKALLDQHPRATPEQIRIAIAGNYCRCGALPNILKAANAVARG
jgi:carbon-monoxide dehydrogenase small subunit/xanthine dehydrogenase YagT iron-sulfur-binding subunit